MKKIMPEVDKKQNAAIMFTDIANFTHYMSLDEKKSLTFLNEKKSQLTSLVKKYNGNYIKDIGDGTLTYYKNSNNALDCALELHKVLPKETGMDIRVGIHYGKILKIKNDIYGDDVNIASRLENLSPEGGICISNIFLNKLENKKNIKTDYIGLQSFKGVGRLIDVYAINDKRLKKPVLSNYVNENIKVDNQKKPSIVLFPFNNRGSKKDNFYSYSLSADISADLTTKTSLKVSSFNEVESMIKRKYKYSTICNKLNFRYYITGDLWKEKSHFNLSIELFDTKSNKSIWSDNWMEKWDSLPKIKNNLVDNILKIFSNKDQDSVNIDDDLIQSSPIAYEQYLKAKYIFKTRSNEKDYNKLEEILNQLINTDKNFIAPYLLFGDYYLAIAKYNKSLKFFESGLHLSLNNNNRKNIATALNGIGKIYYLNGKFDKAYEHYNQALKIWNELKDYMGIADTLNLSGSIHDYNGRYQEALKYYKKSYQAYKKIDNVTGECKTSFNIANLFCSTEKNEQALKYQEISFKLSSKTNNHVMMGYNYNLRGVIFSNSSRFNEAYELFKKSLKIRKSLNDQESIAALYRNIGVVYLHTGLLKQAINYFNRSLEICKDIGYFIGILECHLELAKTYKQMGTYDNAIIQYEKSIDIIRKTEDKFKLSVTMNKLANLYIKMGDYKEALQYYKKSKKIKEKIKDKPGLAYSLLGEARAISWMGEYEKSIIQLKKCIQIGEKFNDQIIVADAKFYLSLIHLHRNNYLTSMKLIDEAINISKNEDIKSSTPKFFDCKGLIYKYQGNLDEALQMHEKALLLSNEINDRHGIRKYLNNKGLIFEEKANFEMAIEIYAECLTLSKQMNEKRSVCVSYCNIGYILDYQGALKQSLKYFKRAYNLATQINYKAGMGGYSNNIGQIYIKQKEYKKSIVLLNSSVKILAKLEIVDRITALIGRAYSYMNLRDDRNLKIDLLEIEKLLKSNPEYKDYKMFWYLYKIYVQYNQKKSADKFLELAYVSLMNRCKYISNDYNKDYFLNTNDAKRILLEIK